MKYDDTVDSASADNDASPQRLEGLLATGERFHAVNSEGKLVFTNEATGLSASVATTGPLPRAEFEELALELYLRTDEMDEEREAAAMDEVQNIMAECFGFGVSMDAVADLRDADPEDWNEGHKHGFADTVVREALMGSFSTMLTGTAVPTYGEARDQDLDMDAFWHLVKVAHDEQYGEQPLPYWMT